MKNILIISFSDLKSDPRVYRQIMFLKDKFKITTIGYKDPEIEGVEFLQVVPKNSFFDKIYSAWILTSRNFEKYYWFRYDFSEVLNKLRNRKFDLIIANDVDSLPFAFKIKGDAKILFDAHEYSPKEFEDSFKWRFFFQKYKIYLCNKYINKVDCMITVCDGIAKEYEKNFGVKPTVVTNAPFYEDLKPSNVDENKIKIIHHGGAIKARNIEKMIDLADYLDDRFTLYFMLVPTDPNYYEYLKKYAEKKNIVFLEPVKMQDISKKLNDFDIGVYILNPNGFNNLNALPNKLFEFIQARLMLAIGPSPEMAKIVKEYDLGIVSDDFEPKTLANKINRLKKEDIIYYKNNSHIAAKELCAEKNKEILISLIEELLT